MTRNLGITARQLVADMERSERRAELERLSVEIARLSVMIAKLEYSTDLKSIQHYDRLRLKRAKLTCELAIFYGNRAYIR